ncbi:MAG: hypothetical protein LC808_32640 [Actinobacteria bacterium]|nr:hypothetical protein [Actinomycetota bacterium]
MSPLAQLMLAVTAWAMAMAAVVVWRSCDQRRRDAARIAYRLRLPRQLTSAEVVAFVRSLTALPMGRYAFNGRDSVVFEIRAAGGRIEHSLLIPARLADAVLAQLRAAVPAVEAEPVTREPVAGR